MRPSAAAAMAAASLRGREERYLTRMSLKMGEIFLKMIQGEASEDEINSLEEASALRDIAHMPARVKCAVLGWRTLKEALLDGDELS